MVMQARRIDVRLGLVLCGSLATALGHAACVQSSSQTYGPLSASAGTTGSTGTGAVGFDKHALLASMANLTTAELGTFAAQADALVLATETNATAPTNEHRDTAREAFRGAVKAWQRLEVMQFGPAALPSLPGGQGLRDEIYAWPATNRCAVDQLLAKGGYADAATFPKTLVNVRGLGAIEHLLFDADATNACSAANALNVDGSWSAIANELPQRRADYANQAAKLVADAAHALEHAWAPDGGNFAAALTMPSPTFDGDVARALDAVAYAFGYLDTKTKDLKLAVPAGLASCASKSCPEALELAEAKLSKLAIRENLLAYQKLFHGGAPFDDTALGFDDWLEALGATELRSEVAASISACIAACEAIEEDDLALAIENDPKSVEDLYFAVKKTTDLVKSQLITVLDLHPPSDAPTDND
jgi:predicted lipoprotein